MLLFFASSSNIFVSTLAQFLVTEGDGDDVIVCSPNSNFSLLSSRGLSEQARRKHLRERKKTSKLGRLFSSTQSRERKQVETLLRERELEREKEREASNAVKWRPVQPRPAKPASIGSVGLTFSHASVHDPYRNERRKESSFGSLAPASSIILRRSLQVESYRGVVLRWKCGGKTGQK